MELAVGSTQALGSESTHSIRVKLSVGSNWAARQTYRCGLQQNALNDTPLRASPLLRHWPSTLARYPAAIPSRFHPPVAFTLLQIFSLPSYERSTAKRGVICQLVNDKFCDVASRHRTAIDAG